MRITHLKVMRAYFFADATRCIYAKVPGEDREAHEHDACGKFTKVMYGTRGAAQKWQRKCSETVLELGSYVWRVSTCHFDQPKWNPCGLVHGAIPPSWGRSFTSSIYPSIWATSLMRKWRLLRAPTIRSL